MAEILFNGKHLDELKCVEIREELGKRGLSRKGIKSTLIKRFEKVLLQEQLEKGSNTVFATNEAEEEGGNSFEEETSFIQEADEQLDISLQKQDENLISAVEVAAGTVEQFDDSYDADKRTTERLESVTSIIEPTFPRDEELIYEGDVDNEDVEDAEMEVDEEEERDELIVDFTAGELDLDPRSFEEEKSASSKALPNSSEKVDTNKIDLGESSEERCNVWVSGLSQLVSASDLKILFSPFGQVLSAKVVARARSAKSQRYGFVTMGTPEQAEKSIQSLNNTELKGKVIVVELTKTSPFVSKQKKEEEASKNAKTAISHDNNSNKPNPSSKASTNTDNKNKSKNDSSKGLSSKVSNSSASSTQSNNKRIISVEKNDGRKELYTASGKRRRDEQKGIDNKRNRSRSPRGVRSPRPRSPRQRSPRPRSPRQRSRSPHARSRSPRIRRRTSPRGRIVSHRLSPIRRISGPVNRRGISPPRRPPSPPLHRRAPSPPPMHRRMPSPPLRRSGGNDDVRRDIMRREMERREIERRDIRNRLGGRIAPPPGPPAVHEIEMRLEEQRRRMATEREALRREVQIEHARKEQELVRQMQEMQQREERDRSMLERQQREFAQLQRTMRERESHIEAKEREIKDKEMRERQRLENLERQKEKDIREKEKRYRDQLERDLKEREMMMQKEQETLRMKLREQERMLLDKERQIRAEQEQLTKAKEDADRKQRRKDDGDIDRDRDRDRKDRGDSRRGGVDRLKDDKDRDDKDRLPKRNTVDESIFGRLGNRDNPSQSGGSHSAAAIVKETQISPNVMYRRIESSGPKPVVNRGVGNPYSQNQSRSKALDSLSANYATPRHSNNPVGYPQTSRYTSGQYSHNNDQSVGYGGGGSNNASNISQFNSSNKLSNLLNNPELLNVLSNVARNSNLPSNAGTTFSGRGGGMGGGFGSNVGSGSGSMGTYHRNYAGPGMIGGSQGRPGFPGMGVSGMEMSQSQFTKHMNKIPPEPDRYNRRIPPRPEPYFNKRM